MSLSFPRAARITRGAELQRIAREGKRIRTQHLEVRAAASPLAHSDLAWAGIRVGLVVPRFKQSAVARNKVKRRLRELSRLQLLPVAVRADVVIRIRPEAYAASFAELRSEVLHVKHRVEEWHVSVTS